MRIIYFIEIEIFNLIFYSNRDVRKFTGSERMLIQNMVCNLSIKRIPDNVIIKQVNEHASKTISKVALLNTRKRVKRDFYQG